ncbi:MAG: hypothetical protein C4539_03585 [Ignavibacteriales bacterium]|nr:MAG: hypothetical protein C4539_03585 [Ignavibacteriales bacterium]
MNNLLSIESLKKIVINLLLKEIGQKLGIESLKNFDPKNSNPRCFFFAKNNDTNHFHWILLNKNYKIIDKDIISKVSDKSKELFGDPKNDEISEENALKIIRTEAQNSLLYNPTLLSESKLEPQSYSIDSKVTIIADNEDVKKEDYKNNLGLSMCCMKDKIVRFSTYAVLDPRSFEPNFLDIILGFEETIYLPIEGIGVFCISWDAPKIDNLFQRDSHNLVFYHDTELDKVQKTMDRIILEKLQNLKCNFKDLIKYNDDNAFNKSEVITRYYNLTQKVSKEFEESLKHLWDQIIKEDKINEGIELLKHFIKTVLQNYQNYIYNFDNYIIQKNVETGTPRQKEILEDIKSIRIDPLEQIKNYIKELSAIIPTLKYYENLEKIIEMINKEKPELLYGTNDIVPALSYLTHTPLLENIIDTNENTFKKKVLNAKYLTQKAINNKSIIIGHGAEYKEFGVNEILINGIFDKEIINKKCKPLSSLPIKSEGIINRINILKCY